MCKKKLEERRNKKHELKEVKEDEINNMYNKHKQDDWTIYFERQHLENLLCQRFNFLIVVYSLFVAAFATIEGKDNKLIILFLGFIVVSLLCLTVMRICERLEVVLKFIYKIQDNPLSLINIEVKKRNHFPNFDVNPIIGYVVPGIMVLSLILGIVFIFMGWWNVDAAETITKCQCAASNVVM